MSASSDSGATTGPLRRSWQPRARCSDRPATGPRYAAARPEGPSPTVTAYDTDDDEARGVARALGAAHRADVPWSRLAVLYRVNAQSALFEEAFSRAGVPFRVRGGGRFLERPEVKVVLDTLQESARKAPSRTFAEHLTDLTANTEEVSEERQEHIDAVVRLGREYLDAEGGPGVAPEWQAGSVDGFFAFLRTALRGDDANPAGDDVVELLTFHRAKGLEFDTVFVTGLERGFVPISHAKTSEALDEEQRLLYVALSRAERVLQLSWARQRTFGARVGNRTPSQWLARIERAIDGTGDDGTVDVRERIADARAHVSKQKTSKRDVPEADAPLFTALVEWRRRLSRASGAPAYVVFHDTTLAAIASARPRTRGALLTVPGVGPIKAERYGDAVLALVGEHARGPSPTRPRVRGGLARARLQSTRLATDAPGAESTDRLDARRADRTPLRSRLGVSIARVRSASPKRYTKLCVRDPTCSGRHAASRDRSPFWRQHSPQSPMWCRFASSSSSSIVRACA